MSFPSQPFFYRTQVLRMWVECPPGRSPTWRFSLEDIRTGERYGFTDLDELACYLLDLMEEADGSASLATS